ncbi:MAG: c-type cytochrome [Chloroflexi bacterium]|nr:c-type cytochrome [Chloroflexota bacterium]
MFNRSIVLIGFALLFVFAAQTIGAEDPPGAKLFGTYCADCHGAAGQGGFAISVGGESYLNTRDDAAITHAIINGTGNKDMPAWSKSNGGKLTDDQIADIVAYLRGLSPSGVLVTKAPVSPVVYSQTNLALTQAQNKLGKMVVTATLKKTDGAPVNGATVVFTRQTTFGVIEMGKARTDSAGVASLIVDEQPERARHISATFKGDPALGLSAGMIELGYPVTALSHDNLNLSSVHLAITDEPLVPPEGNLFSPNPPIVPTAIFLLVVGCIWTIYGYVVSQVVGIWKIGQINPRQNVFRIGKR